MRTVASRVLTAVALLVASGAWAGWVYLHTAGDPSRSASITRSVLADPAARQDVAAELSSSVATAANTALAQVRIAGLPVTVNGDDPNVKAAVAAVLADPTLAGTVAGIVSAVQAQAVGLTPTRPIVVDPAVVTSAARRYVATIDPALVAQVPTLAAVPITLPAVQQVPVAAQLRQRSASSVTPLALVAAALLGLAFLAGNRPRVLRAVGLWAVAAGGSWLLLPRIAAWAAHRWVTGHNAIVHAALSGLGGSMPITVIVLLTAGAAAVVASIPWTVANGRRLATVPAEVPSRRG